MAAILWLSLSITILRQQYKLILRKVQLIANSENARTIVIGISMWQYSGG